MKDQKFAITNYVQDGKVRSYQTKSITPHHEFIRSQFPAETLVGTISYLGDFGMRIADDVIANDGWREWKKQRKAESDAIRARRMKEQMEKKRAAKAAKEASR
jgi:hypothetical protein